MAGLTDVVSPEGKGRIQMLTESVVRQSGLEAMLKKAGGDELEELANVNELISSAAEYDESHPDGSLDEYLGIISLVSDADHLQGAGGAVTLMTLHAAKGLEFPVVAIIGLEEGILPHSRARTDQNQLEEERRLFFVGITRARERLIITKAATRTQRGLRERTATSPFLNELPEEALRIIDHAGRDFRDDWQERNETNQVSAAITQFREGQRVRHPMHGMGRIAEVSGTGQRIIATVEFERAGRKRIVLGYSPLEPA